MSSQSPGRYLSRGGVIAYGLPGLVTAIPIIPIAILLPSYYALELGLGFTLTGLALGASRLLDFFSDILVGIGVDRYRWPMFGKRVSYQFKPWLVVGACTSAIGLYQLANPIEIAENLSSALYLVIWSSVLFFGWTLMMVPYTAWGAVLSDDLHDRSKLTVARESASLVGMLLALSAPAVFSQQEMSPIAIVFWLTVGLGVPILTFTLAKVPEHSVDKTESHTAKIQLADTSQLLKYKPFRFTLLCWFLNSLANGLPAVLFPIVVQKYLLFDEQGLFILLFLYFGAGIVMAPVWLKLAERWGKINAWKTAITFNIVIFSSVLLIDPSSNGLFSRDLFYWICALSGMSLSADMALPASLQADVMEADRNRHGKHRTGTAFALWSMATKLALAVAIVIGFVSLGLNGNEGQNANAAPSSMLLLSLYVCLPIVIKLFVIFMLGKLSLRTETGDAWTN